MSMASGMLVSRLNSLLQSISNFMSLCWLLSFSVYFCMFILCFLVS